MRMLWPACLPLLLPRAASPTRPGLATRLCLCLCLCLRAAALTRLARSLAQPAAGPRLGCSIHQLSASCCLLSRAELTHARTHRAAPTSLLPPLVPCRRPNSNPPEFHSLRATVATHARPSLHPLSLRSSAGDRPLYTHLGDGSSMSLHGPWMGSANACGAPSKGHCRATATTAYAKGCTPYPPSTRLVRHSQTCGCDRTGDHPRDHDSLSPRSKTKINASVSEDGLHTLPPCSRWEQYC